VSALYANHGHSWPIPWRFVRTLWAARRPVRGVFGARFRSRCTAAVAVKGCLEVTKTGLLRAMPLKRAAWPLRTGTAGCLMGARGLAVYRSASI